MDGWVTVGTRLDTKQLEKDLKDAERRLKQYEREAEKLTKAQAKAEIDLQPYEEEKKLIQESTNESNRLAQTQEEVISNLDIEKRMLEELNQKYSTQLTNLDEINQKIKENAHNQGLATNEVAEANNKLQQARGYENIENITERIGKGTSNVIKKIGKWALAIFSVHSAYMFVRQAVSTISQYNQQLASDLEYIRYATSMVLQPVIEYLVNLVYKLLQYVNYIANAWFGVNLFANASSDAFNKANNNANKLKKTLAGFDEMNVLNNDGSSGLLGGLPTQDLSQVLGDDQVPAWLRWIKDNKDLIAGVTRDLLILFGAVTVSKVLKNIATLFGASGGMGLIGLKEILAIIGTTYVVSIAVKGVIEAKKQFDELNEQIQDNTTLMENNRKKAGEIIEKYQELIETGKITDEQLESYNRWLNESIDNSILLIDQLEGQKTWFGELTGTNKDLTEQQQIQIDKIKKLLTAYSNLYNQGLLNDEQQETYKEALEKTLKVLDDQGVEVDNLRKDYEELTGKDYTITIKAKADTAQASKDYSNFFTKLGDSLGVVLNPTEWGSGFTKKLKNIWSGKKLAVGGIVNMPGRGIMYGDANIAERGAEGVIPLTNSQMMARLGEAIGRYVTINANITNTMNGRIISRELQKINNNSDFATNN